MQVDGPSDAEYSGRVARKRVLFDNSIVCLVFLFFVVFLTAPKHSPWAGVVAFLDASFWCLFVRSDCSDSDSAWPFVWGWVVFVWRV